MHSLTHTSILYQISTPSNHQGRSHHWYKQSKIRFCSHNQLNMQSKKWIWFLLVVLFVWFLLVGNWPTTTTTQPDPLTTNTMGNTQQLERVTNKAQTHYMHNLVAAQKQQNFISPKYISKKATSRQLYQLDTGNYWHQFPDLTLSFYLQFPQRVKITYHILTTTQGTSHLVNRLMIDGQENVEFRSISGNTKYHAPSKTEQVQLSKGAHNVQVQCRSPSIVQITEENWKDWSIAYLKVTYQHHKADPLLYYYNSFHAKLKYLIQISKAILYYNLIVNYQQSFPIQMRLLLLLFLCLSLVVAVDQTRHPDFFGTICTEQAIKMQRVHKQVNVTYTYALQTTKSWQQFPSFKIKFYLGNAQHVMIGYHITLRTSGNYLLSTRVLIDQVQNTYFRSSSGYQYHHTHHVFHPVFLSKGWHEAKVEVQQSGNFYNNVYDDWNAALFSVEYFEVI